jgi:hypothetical protein
MHSPIPNKGYADHKFQSASSISSSNKTKKMVSTLMDHYGNCSNFKLCTENEEFYKHPHKEGDKEERHFMLLSTPPNANNKSKYMMVHQHTNNGLAQLFSCTPNEDKVKTVSNDIKPINMFPMYNHGQ